MKILREDRNLQNPNMANVNNINININMNNNNNNNNSSNNNGNNMNMGMQMDLNNNLNNNMNMGPNMMMINQMNLQPNQGFMIPQQHNVTDFNYGPIYNNENFMNKNMYMPNQGTNKGFNNMNNMNFYGNFKNN